MGSGEPLGDARLVALLLLVVPARVRHVTGELQQAMHLRCENRSSISNEEGTVDALLYLMEEDAVSAPVCVAALLA